MADTPAEPTGTPEERLAAYFADSKQPPQPKAKPDVTPEPQETPVEEASGEQTVAEDATAGETQPEEISEPIVEVVHNDKKLKMTESAAKEFEAIRSGATQVAQRTAELKRQLDTRAQAMQLQQQFEESSKQDREEINELDVQLKNIRKALSSDEYTMEQKFNLSILETRTKEAKAEKLQQLDGKLKQFSTQTEQLKEEAKAKGVEYLRRSIPQFGERHVGELVNYAVANGYMKQEIEEAMDPRVLRDIWKAAQWDALQASKGATVHKAITTAPGVKSTGTAGREASSVKQYNEMRAKLKRTGSVEDFAALLLRRK
jgi:uncharacterized phage infection (PIP) family protein YhgE